MRFTEGSSLNLPREKNAGVKAKKKQTRRAVAASVTGQEQVEYPCLATSRMCSACSKNKKKESLLYWFFFPTITSL